MRSLGLALAMSLVAAVTVGACSSSDGNKDASGSGGTGGLGGTSAGGTSGGGTSGGGTSGGGTTGTGGSSATDAATDSLTSEGGTTSAQMTFFVSSTKSMTGNLGGLAGADQRCQTLAAAVGRGSKTWHAYLSADAADGGAAVNAKDRIGAGPWFNANGVMVAANVTALHARKGDAAIFVDERANKIPGQWAGSPSPVEHDVLTGSNPDGTLMAGKTCLNWTSTSATDTAWVGHTDGLGPGGVMISDGGMDYTSWSSVHENGGCADTAPRGGAGRIYCFAID